MTRFEKLLAYLLKYHFTYDELEKIVDLKLECEHYSDIERVVFPELSPAVNKLLARMGWDEKPYIERLLDEQRLYMQAIHQDELAERQALIERMHTQCHSVRNLASMRDAAQRFLRDTEDCKVS
jgi:hypothetical protein